MRRFGAALCALLAALLLGGGIGLMSASSAQATGGSGDDQVCSGLDSGKIDVSGEKLSITVTAPEGKLISGYCVKAGSTESGNGPHYVTLDTAQKTVTLTYVDGDGKAMAISHYSLSFVDDTGESGPTLVEPTVHFDNPTCDETSASWHGYVDGVLDAAGDGVTFAVTSGTVAPGNTVTVTATAEAGYEFAGGVTAKEFTHTFTAVPTDCAGEGGDTEVVAPDVQFTNPTCDDTSASWHGFVDDVADSSGDGVTFAVTSGTVAPGKTVTVTATAEAGYAFAGGLTTMEFSHTFTAVPTGCGGTVAPPGGTGGPSGGTGTTGTGTTGTGTTGTGTTGTGTTVAGPQTSGNLSSTVPTVVEAGLPGDRVDEVTQSWLGRSMVAAGLVLLLGTAWLGLRRRGGAHRA